MAENGGAAKSSLAGNHVDTEISGGNGNGNSTAANLVQFAVQVATIDIGYDIVFFLWG